MPAFAGMKVEMNRYRAGNSRFLAPACSQAYIPTTFTASFFGTFTVLRPEMYFSIRS